MSWLVLCCSYIVDLMGVMSVVYSILANSLRGVLQLLEGNVALQINLVIADLLSVVYPVT